MAAERVPDEILQLILTPSLTITRQQFISPSLTAFGHNDAVSSASVLLVCKRWLRVATPILYETVIIRSTGQSRTLANTFCRNPGFAKYVQKLRLEGAYALLDEVLPACTNLATLVLLLHIYSKAHVTGLCRSLHLINPVEVILRDEWSNTNAKVRDVFINLCHAITVWTNLISFHYPYIGAFGSEPIKPGSTVGRRDHLVDALSKSKSLRTFHSSGLQFFNEQWKKLAAVSSIDFKFYCSNIELEALKDNLKDTNQDAKLSKYSIEFIDISEPLTFVEESEKSIEKACSLSTQRYSFEAIDDNIWSTIVAFAVLPAYPASSNRSKLLLSDALEFNKARRAVSLVCRKFERLVRPLFFEFPLIHSLPSLRVFTEKILKTPSQGREVRVMSFYCPPGSQEPIAAQLCILIPHLTRLSHFSTWRHGNVQFLMTPELFSLFVKASGDTLLTLIGVDFPDHLSLAFLNSFKCLKALAIVLTPHDKDRSALKPDALASLQTLDMYPTGPLSDEFCALSLPVLRSLSIHDCAAGTVENFLKSVERPVTDLRITGLANFAEVFNFTPYLLRLEWTPQGPSKDPVTVGEAFRQPAAHAKLEQLTLPEVASPRYGKKQQNSVIKTLFSCLNLENFPSLKEIHFPNYEWPVDTHAISKQLLPKKAVQVKQKYDVDITDKSGKPWRPRAH